MNTEGSSSNYKVADPADPVENGYDKWKNRKIWRGLRQARSRDAMIPAQRVWAEIND
ncbi:MAG TPA: hypothetical protein VGN36_02225 [Sphingorhabdus sp.]|nr:hypothetical protein [Sphingorhabdus sp.]